MSYFKKSRDSHSYSYYSLSDCSRAITDEWLSMIDVDAVILLILKAVAFMGPLHLPLRR